MKLNHTSVAAAMLVALLGVLSAPAWAGANINGKIAYEVCDYSSGPYQCDIWTMESDGSNAVNITNTPEVSEYAPVWSPDGLRIAFSRGLPDDYLRDLWVMDQDGANQINVTNDPGWTFGPTWSPGGTQLAFVKNIPGDHITAQFDIFIHDLDTGQERNLTHSDFDELEPAWSPDGGLIAFSAVRLTWDGFGAWEIVTVEPTGDNELILTAPDGRHFEDRAPAWAPDGTKLVFMSQFNDPCCEPWDIWAMNRDGSGLTNLTQHPADDMFPSWSPDGLLIVFTSTRDGGWDLYSMPAPPVLPPEARARARAAGDAQRLTRNGAANNADWGSKEHEIGDPFGLYVSVVGSGRVTSEPAGIACGRDCDEVYPYATVVKLRAKPKAGFRFVRWEGACSGKKDTCRVTLDDAAAVIAKFKPLP
ncbi:InlB B-repeat-containing protein [Ideonella sp. YS5]|uniref:InlB B-repeat-containing protein n=1 Tax=Ideonella sp. YS5 TaxID=3453714 RepID=UPI003EF03F56